MNLLNLIPAETGFEPGECENPAWHLGGVEPLTAALGYVGRSPTRLDVRSFASAPTLVGGISILQTAAVQRVQETSSHRGRSSEG